MDQQDGQDYQHALDLAVVLQGQHLRSELADPSREGVEHVGREHSAAKRELVQLHSCEVGPVVDAVFAQPLPVPQVGRQPFLEGAVAHGLALGHRDARGVEYGRVVCARIAEEVVLLLVKVSRVSLYDLSDVVVQIAEDVHGS